MGKSSAKMKGTAKWAYISQRKKKNIEGADDCWQLGIDFDKEASCS